MPTPTDTPPAALACGRVPDWAIIDTATKLIINRAVKVM
jgi:hypothetical protein